MALYEGMFLLDNRQANRDWDGMVAVVKKVLSDHGAEILRMDKWAERKLAYHVKGQKRGTYLLIHFSAEKDAPTRIYRDIEISEVILRALILKVDKLPPEPERQAREEPKAETAAPKKPEPEREEPVEEAVSAAAEPGPPEAAEETGQEEKGE